MQSVASDKYEHAFVSAVVRPDEIGIKFEDVAGLEYAKKALCGLVLLPITRPELFSHGNLLLVYNLLLSLICILFFIFLQNFKL